MSFFVFTRSEGKQFVHLMMWLLELPKKGEHWGAGKHVPIEQAPTDTRKQRIRGWATRAGRIIRHPANDGSATDQFAVEIVPVLQSAWDAKKASLSTAKRTAITDHVQPSLDASWTTEEGYEDGEDFEPDQDGSVAP